MGHSFSGHPSKYSTILVELTKNNSLSLYGPGTEGSGRLWLGSRKRSLQHSDEELTFSFGFSVHSVASSTVPDTVHGLQTEGVLRAAFQVQDGVSGLVCLDVGCNFFVVGLSK